MTGTGPLTADPLTWAFVAIVAAAAGLALIAVRGTQSLTLRGGAVVLAALLMGAGYAGLTELMSRPKPAALEWVRANVAGATVAGSLLREKEAIYLWLVFDGETEPRAYRLPWNEKMAAQLRSAQQEAARRQTRVRMKSPFRGQDMTETERKRVFYAPPRPPLPPKTANAS